MKFLITIIFFLVSFSAKAITADSSFFYRIYLPFGAGKSITDDSKTYSGTVMLSGFEYRFRKSNGLLIRFNIDHRTQKYKITGNPTYNISHGKLEFNDYLIGLGNRFGKMKFKVFGLLQGGITSYKYLFVSGDVNDYRITEVKNKTLAFRGTMGIEYYLNSNFTFTFESSYTIIPAYSIFWDKNLNITEFSLGITTTLF